MLNIRNRTLTKIFLKDKKLGELSDEISITSDIDDLEKLANKFVKELCNAVSEHFHKELKPPKISFLDYIDSDYYRPNTNTIYLNPYCIRRADILHEFRHYLQCQFKEISYYKGNLAPLPRPFYKFQLHERNAYNFQHRYEVRDWVDKSKECAETFNNFKHLIKIGAFNPIAFHIEHEYYKDYNILFDQMNMSDEEIASNFLNGSVNNFTQNISNQNAEITYYNTDRNFFNLKYEINNHKYEANIEVKNDKCVVYGINICEDIMICEKNEYKKACNLAFDFASNVSKVYKINELDINPYSLNIHKTDFRNIINEYKEKHLGINDYFKFNHIPNPNPKDDITKELIEKLNIVVNAKENNYINQDDILENNKANKTLDVNLSIDNINRNNDTR